MKITIELEVTDDRAAELVNLLLDALFYARNGADVENGVVAAVVEQKEVEGKCSG